ncbi:MAG TPA: class I SAM-dependent methyltransferase [Cyclobacteriaceae bacterium]
MRKLSLLIFILISFSSIGQDQWKDVYKEAAWTERDAWQKPQELIKQLNIKKGCQVADIGCHEGYMTFKLAKEVGENGKVFAVDVNQGKLDKMKVHIDQRKVNNITLVKGDYDNPKLPSNALDAVIILDTYHEMDDHDRILQHIKAALKPGGRLVLCEPIAEERKKLTRSEQEKKHELGISFALADLEKAGFKILTRQDPFADREKIKGDKMWMIVATK